MYLCVRMCTGARGGQKRAPDLRQLELQAAVSHLTEILGTELWTYLLRHHYIADMPAP